MLIYHGSGQTVEYPDIRITRFTKDFGYGFYCTKDQNQAEQWAARHGSSADIPTVNIYEYTPDETLRIKSFPKMSDEWLDFIAACRSGGRHNYDIVEGPMADDQVWTYVEDFLDGTLSRNAFWILAEFKKPTHQISFHTANALTCLRFKKAVIL